MKIFPISCLVILYLAALPFNALSQENADTIITIKDTLIRIAADSIIQQERGKEDEVLLTRNDTTRPKWQKMEKIFRRDSTRRVNVIGFPIIAYRPETDWTFGATVQFFFRPQQIKTNHQSAFRIKGQYTLYKQYEVFAEYEVFLLKKNRIWFDGIVHYLNWLEEFYGIGNETRYESREIIEYQHWFSDLRFLYKIWKIHVGPQFRFSRVSDMRYAVDSTFDNSGVTGKAGYQTTGIGAAAILDTRDNNLFPFTGYYISISTYGHPKWTTREEFTFSSLEFDYRHFFNPRKGKHILAIRSFISAYFGEPTFRLMSLHGGQYLGRGYYEGRYRDHHMWLAQTEWRYPLVWHFRGVLFASAGDVARTPPDLSLQTINWSVGVGLRFVVDLKERTTIRLDYAHGKSKTDKGFYFGVNEVF